MDRNDARALHERVCAFIAESERGSAPSETFEALALAVLARQAERVPAYGRLLAQKRLHPRDVDTPRVLPAVPTDAFRLVRVAAHPPSDDVALFRTSGTTGGPRGEHALSTTKTYEASAMAWGRWALFFDRPQPLHAIVLAPPPSDPATRDSSLYFMMQLFAASFATNVHYAQASAGSPFDISALVDVCAETIRARAPALVMGTSFAFVHVLDALAGRRLELPSGSRAMHTGGYKGRSRMVEPIELRRQIAETFAMAEAAVVGEYGMTELGSQLYEPTLRRARGQSAPSASHGTFVPPPWLRVVSVDPETLLPLPSGEVGILRFEDLTNVDSALIVQTADRGRCTDGGVELLGRSPGAPPRGCSLTIEELVSGR
jgi:hypothetical protein